RPLHTLDMGKVSYADDGKTVKFDGRVRMFAVGSYPRREPAQILVDELARGSQSSWILEEIRQPAQGRVQVLVNGDVVAETTGEVVIQPKETLTLAKVEFAKGFQWHGFADRTYRGALSVRWGGQNALDAVVSCDFELVLAGVVPAEISSKAATGALQAQAVAARGEILSKMGLRHCNEGFDTCAEQHCQVYAGDTAVARQIAPVIAPTRGLILQASDGAIVDAVYAANCGGHSEANHLVWTTSADPILAGQWDGPKPNPVLDLSREADVKKFIRTPPKSYCNDKTVEGGDKYRWKTPVLGAKWRKVEEAAGVGRIREIKDFARGVSGRLYKLTIVGESGTKTIMKELNIRKLFGMLRSACFIATWKRDKSGFVDGAVFEGAGWGHGVGMCQTGAQSLAKKGWPFQKILAHYFPGSRLVKTY
ncbi:MAG TPA: SpoIID/LytB domain-containing protein, partial [Candidatus Ozemobacteraceae bacterium]|nr:SpoIID/LytB domain-containing protein [Candidatus Ozemobacteraceae bacterium]